MKYINFVFLLFLISISCNNEKKSSSQMFSGYKFITTFSKNIRPGTGLVLRSYGANHHLPKDYPFKNEVATLSAAYALYKTQQDTISLEQARGLIVSLTESFINSVNSDPEIRPYLETYPFNIELVDLRIDFIDANKIDLGTGVCEVYLRQGKIKYERYDIYEYTGHYPATGEHFIIHKEPYEEALEIVKNNGTLVYFQ